MTTHPVADRFAIIPLPNHGPVPADAIAHGSLPTVMEQLPDTHARNDAIEQAAKAVVDAEEAKELAVEAKRLQDMARANTLQMISDTIAHVASRLDAFIARRDAEEEEAEAKRIQDELNALPDPDDPTAFEDDQHLPGGELHTLPAKDEEEELEPDPDEPSDNMGGVPMPYVRGKRDQAEFPLGEPEDPTGTVIPQPTAIEFDEV